MRGNGCVFQRNTLKQVDVLHKAEWRHALFLCSACRHQFDSGGIRLLKRREIAIRFASRYPVALPTDPDPNNDSYQLQNWANIGQCRDFRGKPGEENIYEPKRELAFSRRDTQSKGSS